MVLHDIASVANTVRLMYVGKSRWAFCLRVRDFMFSHGYIRCYAPARRFLAKCKIKHGDPPFEKFCAVAFNNCVEC